MEKLPQKDLHGQSPVVTPCNRQSLNQFEQQSKARKLALLLACHKLLNTTHLLPIGVNKFINICGLAETLLYVYVFGCALLILNGFCAVYMQSPVAVRHHPKLPLLLLPLRRPNQFSHNLRRLFHLLQVLQLFHGHHRRYRLLHRHRSWDSHHRS